MTRDDFDYALENTHVILAPEHQIATFGSTSFNFYLISELMDRVNQSDAGALLPVATGGLRRQGRAIRGSTA